MTVTLALGRQEYGILSVSLGYIARNGAEIEEMCPLPQQIPKQKSVKPVQDAPGRIR
jgi:hypothetical protein